MTETAQAETSPTSAPIPAEFEATIAEVFGADAPKASTTEEPQTDALVADAPETAEADSKAEEKPEPQKSVGARILAAKRAEMRAERERQEVHALREQLARQKAEQESKEATLRLIEEDPSKYFELRNLGPEAIREHLERLAGTYKPESVANREMQKLKEELAALKQSLSTREMELQTQQQKAAAQASWQQASAEFIEHVSKNVDTYPHLTQEFSDQEVPSVALQALKEVVGYSNGRPITRNEAYYLEHGEYPDNEVIAEYLDELAKQRIEARSKSVWRRRDDASQAGKGRLGEATSARANGTEKPRTLSSRDTSQRSAAPKKWTQEDADAESLRILETALRAKR